MAQGTDLFNSTKGQYGEYTTLIGGLAPDTSSWFLETFDTADNITAISGAFDINSGLVINGSPDNTYSFFQNQKTSLKNCAIVVEYFSGSTALDKKIGVFARESSGDFIYGLVDQTAGEIKISKRESSVDTELSSSGSFSLGPNTKYWLLLLLVDQYIKFEIWSTDPREGGSPLATTSVTLSSADASTFGISSRIGITEWIPRGSDAKILSLEVGRAFLDQTSDVETVLEKQHVDIRDFINYRYPIRFRTIGELNDFKITEKAFSQTITLDDVLTDGTFLLYFYPSDEDPYVPISIGPFNFDATNETIKTELNRVLNTLPKFSVTNEDPIQNVQTKLIESEMTLMVEFSQDFGEISLLRMDLSNLVPAVVSQENYDAVTDIGTFYPTVFDSQKYIETADPLNKQLTLDDLRIEYKFKNENWVLYNGSGGLSAPPVSYFRDGDLKVGKILSEENQRGAHLEFARAMKRAETTVAGTWSVHLQSFSKSVNCKTFGPSSGSHMSIIFAGYPWSAANQSVLDIGPSGCYVQFTSHPLGLFDDQGGNSDVDSEKVYFEDNIYYATGAINSENVEFLCPMTDFESSNNFDFSRLTGVRILLKSQLIAKESSIKIMSIRAIPTTRVAEPEWIKAEINTLEQNVSYPVLGYQQETADLVPMISGAQIETIASDPSPTDSRQALIFQTGLGGGNLNKMMIFGREQEFESATRSAWLTAEYAFSSVPDSYLKRYKTLRVLSSGANDIYWDIHPGGIFEENYSGSNTGISYLPALLSEANYEIAAIFQANGIGFQIQELTSAEQPQRVIYDAPYASSLEWATVSGRIGWYVEFADKDMAISAFDLESAAYAILRTKQFISETPIEGAQLFTVDSGEKNLFERFFSLSPNDRVYIDNQKTASGLGSFAFQSNGQVQRPGVISNQFTVNDWNHIYIEFDIWVPRDLRTPAKRPKFALRPVEQPEGTNGADVFSGIVPANAPVAFDFIAGAWSKVSFDLRGTNAKNGDYYLVIFSDGDGDELQSTFRNTWWIDNVRINTQTIEWELRAIENGSWTPFRKNVNRQYGALHLSENQIGKNVQLQAKALTEDAWIAEYTLIPKYLSLGRILSTNRYILEEQQ